jgi:hypothetical protein
VNIKKYGKFNLKKIENKSKISNFVTTIMTVINELTSVETQEHFTIAYATLNSKKENLLKDVGKAIAFMHKLCKIFILGKVYETLHDVRSKQQDITTSNIKDIITHALNTIGISLSQRKINASLTDIKFGIKQR